MASNKKNKKNKLSILNSATLILKEQEQIADQLPTEQRRLFIARKGYLDEMRRDLEEITAEIIVKDSFKEILSLLGTKYAIERNILAAERNLLSEKRTTAANRRNELSEKRSGLARVRTGLSQRRTFLAEKRTIMAQHRNLLAKARTELAFIRTGVAFVALATGLIRYFGIGWWTVMDASILILGIGMVTTGIYYYLPTRKREVGILEIIRQKEEEIMKKRPRVLILDDDPALCDLLKVYLKKNGYEVEAYLNPFPAQQRLQITQFDIVITDYLMENADGEQVVQMIKRIAPETAIIMISFMSPDEEPIAQLQSEIFAFFQKPINLNELHESIKKALRAANANL